MTDVYCKIPFTSFTMDMNKGIRPCCAYGSQLGNVATENIVDIISSNNWKILKEQLSNNIVPYGCIAPCQVKEQLSGSSARTTINSHPPNIESYERNKLNFIEFNGSNICNAACLHCSQYFSSRWSIDNKKAIAQSLTYDINKRNRLDGIIALAKPHAGFLPNSELVISNLKLLDLSELNSITFKGGEPFLNLETWEVLEYLDGIHILSNLEVIVVTNGTVINEKIVDLLAKCKNVRITISVDGVNELYNYIRYSDVKFEFLENNISIFNSIPSVQNIHISTTVMNYNIFNLNEITNWSIYLASKYKKFQSSPYFENILHQPSYLSIQTLSDQVRQQLIEHYTNENNDLYKHVITALGASYSGDEIHDKWVMYTELMESIRNNSIVNIQPSFKKELELKG